MAIVIGLFFVAIGLWGLNRWIPEFLALVKGLVPLVFLTSGILAIVVGLTSLGSRRSGKS